MNDLPTPDYQSFVIRKACPTGEEAVADVMIVIGPATMEGVIPQGDPDWERKYDIAYRYDADRLAEALRLSLPGGTFDRLVVRLLEFRTSMLRISHVVSETVPPPAPVAMPIPGDGG